MNKEIVTVNLPLNEWEKIQADIASVEELKSQIKDLRNELADEKLNKAVLFRIGTDYKYKVTVTTMRFGEKFIDTKYFEDEIKNAVEREMELRKEYDEQIEKLLKVFGRTPLWLLKWFGLKEKKSNESNIS